MGGISSGGGMSARGGAAGGTASNTGGNTTVDMTKNFGATGTNSLISQSMIYVVVAVVVIGFFIWLIKKKK